MLSGWWGEEVCVRGCLVSVLQASPVRTAVPF